MLSLFGAAAAQLPLFYCPRNSNAFPGVQRLGFQCFVEWAVSQCETAHSVAQNRPFRLAKQAVLQCSCFVCQFLSLFSPPTAYAVPQCRIFALGFSKKLSRLLFRIRSRNLFRHKKEKIAHFRAYSSKWSVSPFL